MNDYSDEDLLFMTSLKNESEEDAKEAFTVFYHRYKQFLWNLCFKICQDYDMAQDVTQNTWIAIYKYGHTYDVKKSKVTTWMSRIANNEMRNLFKGETDNIPLNENVCSIPNDDYEEVICISPEKRILEEALNQLSERDKDILLTCMQHADGTKHLPDEVIRGICQRCGTTPEYLRQIKKRSLEKVKDYITSNNKHDK